MDKFKDDDIPKAGAEGDKFPEIDMPEIEDPMNMRHRIVTAIGDPPKAVAEGDKLPEVGD